MLCMVLCVLSGCKQPEKVGEPENTPTKIVKNTVTPSITEEPKLSADEMYKEVLAQYKDAVEHDFYRDLLDSEDPMQWENAFGEFVALELRAQPQPVYYSFYDVDQNGTKECLIGTMNGTDTPNFYDILGYDGSKVVRLFEDMEFGYRTSFTVYEGGTIGVTWSASAFESGQDYYKIAADGYCMEQIASFAEVYQIGEEEKESVTYLVNQAEVSEEEFQIKQSDYEALEKQKLEWVSVAGK